MEENNMITIASIEERDKLVIHIKDNLEPQSECCIYRVPEVLRKINKQAYTPKVISIGPLHHGRKEFIDMEKQKIRYRREFSKRFTDTETWQKLINFLEEREQSIRNCYEETCKLQKSRFIAMILHDAVFIIELFLRHHHNVNDFLLRKELLNAAIQLDLQLLENQLPYFVLEKLYLLAFPYPIAHEKRYPSFFDLSCEFFDCTESTEIAIEEKVKHFTDLTRHAMTKMYPEPESKELVKDLPSAVKLHKSGVKFKCNESNCPLGVRLVKQKRIIACLEEPELQIPRIEVYDDTEALFRNVMALEQCHYPEETQICNLILLMDFLINTENDVDLLEEQKIISTNIGDSYRVARMFNKLGLQIIIKKSGYHGIVKDLKDYHERNWNRTKAILRSVYFKNFWRGTGTCAATLLLLLAIIQTVCSIRQLF